MDSRSLRAFWQAADFLKTNHLHGNLFNEYQAGGYLIWRLSPDIRVFVDGRGLYAKIFDSYRIIVDNPFQNDNYSNGLDYFQVDMVMIPGCDRESGTLIKLAAALLEDSKWVLIYDDADALVFTRNAPKNAEVINRLARPKREGYRNIYSIASMSRTGHAARMQNWKLSMAVANEGVGELREALVWLDDYMKTSPDDTYAKSLRQRIVAKMR